MKFSLLSTALITLLSLPSSNALPNPNELSKRDVSCPTSSITRCYKSLAQDVVNNLARRGDELSTVNRQWKLLAQVSNCRAYGVVGSASSATSKFRDVAAGAQTIVNTCGGDGYVRGYNTAGGNGNYVIQIVAEEIPGAG